MSTYDTEFFVHNMICVMYHMIVSTMIVNSKTNHHIYKHNVKFSNFKMPCPAYFPHNDSHSHELLLGDRILPPR